MCLQTHQVSWMTHSLTPLKTAFEWCAAVAVSMSVCLGDQEGEDIETIALCSALGAGL